MSLVVRRHLERGAVVCSRGQRAPTYCAIVWRRSQNGGRRVVVGQRDGGQPRALLLRNAELHPPAEQESRNDPVLAGNAGDGHTGLLCLPRDRKLLSVAEEASGWYRWCLRNLICSVCQA